MKILLIAFFVISQLSGKAGTETIKRPAGNRQRVNIFVLSNGNKKLDLTNEYVKIRAGVNAFHAPSKFILIIAGSSQEAAEKIDRKLKRRHRMIANLWFDSHGHYGDRYASFSVGKSKYYFKNISDSNHTRSLKNIARYCDSNTRIGLGACYAGADYAFPATDTSEAVMMKGDSLLLGLGKIFSTSSIYASKSWVMTKPGMFTTRYGFAGYPIQKRFLDEVYKPVWEQLGSWAVYLPQSNRLETIPTVSINRWGDLLVQDQTYSARQKAKHTISKKKSQLKPGQAVFK